MISIFINLPLSCKVGIIQIKFMSYQDVASGLNTKRIGLMKLFTLVQKGKISNVFITYPDRLTRFGFEYLKWYFGSYGVTIHCLEESEQKSVQDEMVDDLIAIITSFSEKYMV
jgi:putative resolvase